MWSLSYLILPGAGLWHHGGAKSKELGKRGGGGEVLEGGGRDSAGLSLRSGACLSLSFPFCTQGLGENTETLGTTAD